MSHVNGFLNLDKPRGKTSFAVVSLVKRLTGVRRAGHGGTLDPAATGVLPICLGQATRMSAYLLSGNKRYRAAVRLGIETDTYDAEGQVTARTDASGITLSHVEAALQAFRGRIHQVPPMYSALKRQGRRLYDLARAGQAVELEARQVEVYGLLIAEWAPPILVLDIECGRGTYIRSIAHDLGRALGCGAHLAGLVRTAIGPFTIEHALSIEGLFDAVHGGYWQEHLWPMDALVVEASAAILDAPGGADAREGRLLSMEEGAQTSGLRDGGLCRAYGLDGDFIALLSYDAQRRGWQPDKVFQRESPPSEID